MEELSEYEKERQRNLEANLAQMSEIFGTLVINERRKKNMPAKGKEKRTVSRRLTN